MIHRNAVVLIVVGVAALSWMFGFFHGLGLGYTKGMSDTYHTMHRVYAPAWDQ